MRKTLGAVALAAAFSSLAAGPPVKLEGLKIADFEKLPDDALLDVGGRTVTKRSLLAESRGAAAGAPQPVDASRLKAKFDQEQKGRIQAQDAAVLARVKSLAGGIKAAARPTLSASQAPPMTVAPHSSSVDVSYLQPDALFLVNGLGFGDEPGKVLVTGSWGTENAFAAGVWLAWGPTWAAGRLPSHAAPAQTVTVVVETKDGRRAAPLSVPFQPSRTESCGILRLTSVSSPGGSWNTCAYKDYGPNYIGPYVGCRHTTPPSGYVSVGTDRVSLTLKNGWGVDSYSLNSDAYDKAILQKEIAFTAGAPSLSATFTWAVLNVNSSASWEMAVCASGPNNGLPNQ
jgi:hypothetical protein